MIASPCVAAIVKGTVNISAHRWGPGNSPAMVAIPQRTAQLARGDLRRTDNPKTQGITKGIKSYNVSARVVPRVPLIPTPSKLLSANSAMDAVTCIIAGVIIIMILLVR